jgi:hypothetical protein
VRLAEQLRGRWLERVELANELAVVRWANRVVPELGLSGRERELEARLRSG